MKKNSKPAKKVSDHSGRNVAVGAGILTAAALAGAAAYLLSGKEGEKRRAKMKAWAVKAQKEVAKKVKDARQMGEAQYKNLVDEAVKRYGSLEKVDMQEIMKVAQEMKGDWKQLQKHAMEMHKMVGKEAKAVKKAVTTKVKSAKRSVKKTAKK